MKFLHIVSRKTAQQLNFKFYFTGEPCKRGHFDLRRVVNSSCLSCLELRKGYNQEYYKNNKSVLKQKQMTYYQDNTTLAKEAQAIWRKNNPDYSKHYKKLNPDKYKTYNAKRRARLRNAEGSYAESDIKTLMQSQEYLCAGCGGNLEILKFHVDHKVPLSKGGSNWPENIQLLCPDCNLRKGAKDYEAWLCSLTKVID